MSNDTTNEHREQAREIVERFSLHKVQLIEPPTNRQYHFDVEELIDEITTYANRRYEEGVEAAARSVEAPPSRVGLALANVIRKTLLNQPADKERMTS